MSQFPVQIPIALSVPQCHCGSGVTTKPAAAEVAEAATVVLVEELDTAPFVEVDDAVEKMAEE